MARKRCRVSTLHNTCSHNHPDRLSSRVECMRQTCSLPTAIRVLHLLPCPDSPPRCLLLIDQVQVSVNSHTLLRHLAPRSPVHVPQASLPRRPATQFPRKRAQPSLSRTQLARSSLSANHLRLQLFPLQSQLPSPLHPHLHLLAEQPALLTTSTIVPTA